MHPPRASKGTWSLVLAGFAVSIGLGGAIGLGGDMSMISIMDARDEPLEGTDAYFVVDLLMTLRRPVEFLVPTVLGIIAIVTAVGSLRAEGASAQAILAILLAVTGPLVTFATFMILWAYGTHNALMAGEM